MEVKLRKSKGLGVVIILVLLVSAFFIINQINNSKISASKLTQCEKDKIVNTINSYYNNMANKNYKTAFKLMDYSNLDINKDLEILSNAKEYKIEPILEDGSWIVPTNGTYYISFDDNNKDFVVKTAVGIVYGNEKDRANDVVYIKKIGQSYKIVKIVTSDKYGGYRGSSVYAR
jgi:hypothetical protein